MKLLFLSNLFPDTVQPWRGLDNATLLHHLAKDWEVRALAVRPVLPWQSTTWQNRAQDSIFEPRYVPTPYIPKVGSRWNHRLMARALRQPISELRARFDFNVVLGSWLFPDCCALAGLAQEFDFPFLAICQGSDAHQYLRNPIRRRIMLEKLPRASAIITRSGELARLLAASGIAAEKLHPIYNGIDFEQFTTADQSDARRELGLPSHGRVVLFVGNFYAIKNPLLLVEAHARLCADTDADCQLVMIGGGPLEIEARALAERLGTSARVTFAGRQDASRVARYMQAADVLAVPSRNEGVPNVILEAFACGLPVVATRVGGIPEVLTHDFLGQLVESENREALVSGLRAVFNAPNERTRIHAHAQQFSWARTTAAYNELLRHAVR